MGRNIIWSCMDRKLRGDSAIRLVYYELINPLVKHSLPHSYTLYYILVIPCDGNLLVAAVAWAALPTVSANPIPEAVSQLVETYAQLFKNGQRSPILRRPSEYGHGYKDIFLPWLDGTILQGWFIPAANSKKLIIANHPMTCNRYGYPGHLEGYGGLGDSQVNFLPDYKALHDAGFHIICYDLRNHSISDRGSGAVCGALGCYEARDVVGSFQYARSHPETRDNSNGLLSRCMGSNSTIHAMAHFPKYFTDIQALILLQAVSGHAFVEKGAINANLDVATTVQAFDKRIHELTGFRLKELSLVPLAKNVSVPTLFVQVRKNALIDTKDSQEIFNALV
ncbi:Esterase/lipase [Metarhizium acridum CQMa 102]|uniref:Esterase/lipase n=1 Tax=Metarhizium acridum (strain CQMa 102) TaxID=655827 RepID=E9DQY9_METAQ|nr:Esterase/lipase [Metarhizium acridum CQMa 102]EFY93667.1 Esterase/lipase [Metarhizium acridum CQMa 102]